MLEILPLAFVSPLKVRRTISSAVGPGEHTDAARIPVELENIVVPLVGRYDDVDPGLIRHVELVSVHRQPARQI